jgi:hypothetical protein
LAELAVGICFHALLWSLVIAVEDFKRVGIPVSEFSGLDLVCYAAKDSAGFPELKVKTVLRNVILS